MGLRIINPGLLSLIQDTGRRGHQKEGVIVSGAMDTAALRIGNIILGNNENCASLEITHLGPEIYFEADHIIALTGADLSAAVNGKKVKLWCPILIKRGSSLSFGRPRQGCRSYLSVAGGLEVPKIMGSRSTYLRAGFGGWEGRALKAGDVIPANDTIAKNKFFLKKLGIPTGGEDFVQATWTAAPQLCPSYNNTTIIRAIPGPEIDWFCEKSRAAFWSSEFRISSLSDRMGTRLEGEILALEEKRELLSTAVTFGTVQVPANGNPIILMADSPTTGGYPRIAQLASADLGTLTQLPPGKTIKFKKISLQEAQQLLFQQEQYINLLKRALQLKLGLRIA